MDIRATKLKLFEIIEPVAADEGLEVVDIGLARETGGWVLRVFLDRTGKATGSGVSLGDCESISRELSAVLDVADPIPCAYSLEVSSAGLDRPLRTRDHFAQVVGQTAKIRLETGVNGRKNFTGIIVDVDDSSVEVEVDGVKAELPIDDISVAKLVPDWDALLNSSKLSSKQSSKKPSASKQTAKHTSSKQVPSKRGF